jgi:hypothetical protein
LFSGLTGFQLTALLTPVRASATPVRASATPVPASATPGLTGFQLTALLLLTALITGAAATAEGPRWPLKEALLWVRGARAFGV